MIEISKKLLSTVGRTNAKYSLIKEGDRVLLGLSGGKDSLALAHILNRMKNIAPFKFDLLCVSIDYGMGENFDQLINHCKLHDISYVVHKTNIFETAKKSIRENSSFCSFFSRMRRGALYGYAKEHNFNKLALAHHLDDAVESFFMNFLYNGALRSMPPIYRAKNGILVIRPLIFARERQLIDNAIKNSLPTIGDEACPAMKFKVKMPYAREKTKRLLKELEKENPQLFVSLKSAFKRIHDSSFFDDKRLRR